MTDRADHCPFLNRADARCSEHFNLDHLGYAFKYCCDKYQKCSTYAVLLSERQVRRVNQADPSLSVSSMRLADVRSPFVQVTLHGKVSREIAHQPAQSAA